MKRADSPNPFQTRQATTLVALTGLPRQVLNSVLLQYLYQVDELFTQICACFSPKELTAANIFNVVEKLLDSKKVKAPFTLLIVYDMTSKTSELWEAVMSSVLRELRLVLWKLHFLLSSSTSRVLFVKTHKSRKVLRPSLDRRKDTGFGLCNILFDSTFACRNLGLNPRLRLIDVLFEVCLQMVDIGFQSRFSIRGNHVETRKCSKREASEPQPRLCCGEIRHCAKASKAISKHCIKLEVSCVSLIIDPFTILPLENGQPKKTT